MTTNVDELVQSGSKLFATVSTSMMLINDIMKKVRIEILCNKIQEYLKNKPSVRISDLVERFNESADIIILAVKQLKEKGVIEEVKEVS